MKNIKRFEDFVAESIINEKKADSDWNEIYDWAEREMYQGNVTNKGLESAAKQKFGSLDGDVEDAIGAAIEDFKGLRKHSKRKNESFLNEKLRGNIKDWKVKETNFDFIKNLHKRSKREGIVLLGAGGNKNEWIDGITDMFIEEKIVSDGNKASDFFDGVYLITTTGGRRDMVLFFSKDKGTLNIGKMAMWRLQFGDCSWISDYVVNYKNQHNLNESLLNEDRFTRLGNTDEQEEGIAKVVKWMKKLGKNLSGGTVMPEAPLRWKPAVILDIKYQGSEIYVDWYGEIEVRGDKVIDFNSFKKAINSLNESNNEEVLHFVFLMKDGNFLVSGADDEEGMKDQLKRYQAVKHKVIGISGSYQNDKKNFNKLNNKAHKEGKLMKASINENKTKNLNTFEEFSLSEERTFTTTDNFKDWIKNLSKETLQFLAWNPFELGWYSRNDSFDPDALDLESLFGNDKSKQNLVRKELKTIKRGEFSSR